MTDTATLDGMTRLVPESTFRGFYTRAEEPGVLTFTASSAGVKRDGLNLDLDGMTVDNFLKNPVFLWVHDYAGHVLPIGRVTSLDKTAERLLVKVRFDLDDPFAAEVYRKYRGGFLNAVSIGWDPIEWSDDTVTVSDLLDISAVPVPGDQDALMERALEYARSYGKVSDSPTGVSGETEDTRTVTLQAIDTLTVALQGLRDQLADSPVEPPVTPELPADDGLEGLAELFKET